MSKKVVIDAGHGGFGVTAGKRTPYLSKLGRVIYEWEGNALIAGFLASELQRCGIEVIRTDDITGKTDVPLFTRTHKANNLKVDFFVSLHHNAGGGTGLETFSYPNSSNSLIASRAILDELMKSGVKRVNRGAKTADFHVLRETRMPAVLIEYGFMDYVKDGYQEAYDMLNKEVAKKQAVATAKGICKFLRVQYISEPVPTNVTKPSKMYRLEIENGEVFDTAWRFDLISSKIEAHLKAGKDGVIKVYPRIDNPSTPEV